MKQQAERAAGLDVHRDNVVAATRINEPGGEVTVTKKRFPTTRRGIGELAAFLTDAAVTRVAMEATPLRSLAAPPAGFLQVGGMFTALSGHI